MKTSKLQKNLTEKEFFKVSMYLYKLKEKLFKEFGIDYNIFAVDKGAKQYKEVKKFLKKYENI